MKLYVLILGLFLSYLSGTAQYNQKKYPVMVSLKDGSSIEAVHFGQLKCGTDSWIDNSIILRGNIRNNHTEMDDWNKVAKLVLEGFNQEPVSTVGNEKASIRVFKKNGVAVTLEEAELVMSCYGVGDKYNQIVVQTINPLTDELEETSIDIKDIQSINFR
jgi:hypothetical protein